VRQLASPKHSSYNEARTFDEFTLSERSMDCRTYRIALVVLAVSGLARFASGSDGPTPTDEPASQPSTVEQIVQLVHPALVTISTDGRDAPAEGLGAGFVVSSDGLIATNLHVIGEGREFRVELSDGTELKVLSVHASDPHHDLAIVRVDAQGRALPALQLGSAGEVQQGQAIVVMGNPLGLRHSVVSGVVSAIREIDGQQMIQLAIPIERGNSGGPVVDLRGRVHGIVSMKSLREENVGFAVDAQHLQSLIDEPNPIDFARWATIGALDARQWTPLFGARWRQRGGRITVSGTGTGFGGRSLCVSSAGTPELPFEVAVSVKLADESGAAGLIFHSDGGERSYGFYPTSGKLRLTCFEGPTVYSWRILEDVASEHYRPGDWNHIRVRLAQDELQCFVNDQLVISSRDRTFTAGKVGLAKFRHTEAEFKHFQVAQELTRPLLSRDEAARFTELIGELPEFPQLRSGALQPFADQADASAELLLLEARRLEDRAEQLRKIAVDVHVHRITRELSKLVQAENGDFDLLRGALLLAALDERDVDIDSYVEQVSKMAAEVQAALPAEASDAERVQALNRYLFVDNGFHGSRSEEYYHPANSYLNRVLDDREGIPVTLSVLYIELGRRIGLDLQGVGLPGHFVVKQVAATGEQQLIDVFERGALLSREDAAAMVRLHAQRELVEADLEAASKKSILVRMLHNLGGLAETKADAEALLRYLEALVAIEPEVASYREQRARLRAYSRRFAAAIEDLDWLIERQPPTVDLQQIQALRRAVRQNLR